MSQKEKIMKELDVLLSTDERRMGRRGHQPQFWIGQRAANLLHFVKKGSMGAFLEEALDNVFSLYLDTKSKELGDVGSKIMPIIGEEIERSRDEWRKQYSDYQKKVQIKPIVEPCSAMNPDLEWVENHLHSYSILKEQAKKPCKFTINIHQVTLRDTLKIIATYSPSSNNSHYPLVLRNALLIRSSTK